MYQAYHKHSSLGFRHFRPVKDSKDSKDYHLNYPTFEGGMIDMQKPKLVKPIEHKRGVPM